MKHLIAKCLMTAMYDREPELHPQDAYGLAMQLLSHDFLRHFSKPKTKTL